jgi:hypothetical protein
MSNTSPIRNIRTVKALRGESLTIDLGIVLEGDLRAWMKKDPNDETYRSFNIIGNRYLQLTQAKASDYYDNESQLLESIKGKWFFDVEQILDPEKPEEVQTIYRGTILFKNDITGSVGVEIDDPNLGFNTFIGLYDTPILWGDPGQIPVVSQAGNALVWMDRGIKVELFEPGNNETSFTVDTNAIVDDDQWSVSINGIDQVSRTSNLSSALGNISINHITGEITFHDTLFIGDLVKIKYN